MTHRAWSGRWLGVVGAVLALTGAAAFQRPSPAAAGTSERRDVTLAQDGHAEWLAARDALAALTGALTDGDCYDSTANPERRPCIVALDLGSGVDETARRGIAVFGFGVPEGGGARVVMGRDGAGTWQFWFGTQQASVYPLSLPGAAFVCAGGAGVNVRLAPALDAPIVDTLPDLTAMTVEEFLLRAPGAFGPPPPGAGRPSGWYRISAPAAGWVYMDMVVDAAQPDCAFHDAVLGTR